MHITKLVISNFKIFANETFDFNEDINILVGDNDSGKSTILEAIEIGLKCNYRGKSLYSELTPDLFNVEAVERFLASEQSSAHLPEICIELFLEGVPEYKGDNNSLGEDTQGISLKIRFDDVDALSAYEEFEKHPENIKAIPVEFYKIEWLDFSGKKLKHISKKVDCLFVDPARLHPTYGKNQYISTIIKTTLSKENRALLNLNYRQSKERFNIEPQVVKINNELDSDNIVTDKKLQIVANVSSANSVDGLQLAVDDVSFPLIGKGEQSKIQIKLAIQNKPDNIDVIMVEEPENHLSHINLSNLIKYIGDHRSDKQLFITTHSSYVANKLSLNKLCLIAENYIRLKDLDGEVTERLKRLPGYDTLRIVLSEMVILVEGPSDELMLKRLYLRMHARLPEEDGIDIIVVRGIGFKNNLEIAKSIGTKLNVVKDNDGNYKKNISEYGSKYKAYDFIKFFSSEVDDENTLEPAMIAINSTNEVKLNAYAKIALSTQTFNLYQEEKDLNSKITFLRDWYKGEGAGKKKVDSAMRIFESQEKIAYPKFLIEALKFD